MSYSNGEMLGSTPKTERSDSSLADSSALAAELADIAAAQERLHAMDVTPHNATSGQANILFTFPKTFGGVQRVSLDQTDPSPLTTQEVLDMHDSLDQTVADHYPEKSY